MTQRVIKYRAYDMHFEEMCYVTSMFWLLKKKNGFDIVEGHGVTGTPYRDITITEMNPLMQFTGLLDKHGKEIYEGDIFEYEAWHGGPEHAMLEKSLKEQGKPLPSYKERRVILSHPYGHFITRKLDDITDMTYTGDTFYHTPATTAAWEIIGNIYTTPELVDPKMIER